MAIAAVLLWLSLRGIDWRAVGRVIARARMPLLALAAAMSTSTMFLRAVRWRILLNAEGSVSLSDAFWATAAGLFGNNFLPARAGELVRSYMIAARSSLGSAYVLATALSERTADAIVLIVSSALVLLAMPDPPGWLASASTPFAIVGLAGAAAIAVLPLMHGVLERLIARAPLPAALRPSAAAAVSRALAGMRAFHDAGRLSAFIGLAIVIWFIDTAGTIVTGAALGLTLPWTAAFLLITGMSLGSSLPSTPGYVGIYQFVAVAVLTPFGFARTDAIAYILVVQALGYVVVGLWGAGGIARYRADKME